MRRLFLIALSLTILVPLVAVLLAFTATGSQAQCAGGSAGPGSAPGVPASLLAIFEQAAGSYGLGASGWAYLAAINQIESNFNQSTLPGVHSATNADGAAGPMRIGIGGTAGNTWAKYQVDAPGGATPPSVYDETDAVYAAANYLHASGAPGDWPAALYAYNHAGWYVAQVQQLAQQYAQAANGTGAPATDIQGLGAPAGCVTAGPTTPGTTARILPDGLAATPRTRPPRCRPRSPPATGSSTPPTAPSASRTCSPP
jgi:Transglycosylase SLT domain